MADSWRCNSAQYHRTCCVAQLSSWRSEGWCLYASSEVAMERNIRAARFEWQPQSGLTGSYPARHMLPQQQAKANQTRKRSNNPFTFPSHVNRHTYTRGKNVMVLCVCVRVCVCVCVSVCPVQECAVLSVAMNRITLSWEAMTTTLVYRYLTPKIKALQCFETLIIL